MKHVAREQGRRDQGQPSRSPGQKLVTKNLIKEEENKVALRRGFKGHYSSFETKGLDDKRKNKGDNEI